MTTPKRRRPLRPRRLQRPEPPVEQPAKAYVAVFDDVQQDPLIPGFVTSLARIGAETMHGAPPNDDLWKGRKYRKADLMAVAEVGYHYLFAGAPRIAEIVFEGLIAVQPQEAYFWLALGLTSDRLGKIEMAHRAYKKAAELDPSEGRADINRAELKVEARDYRSALELLRRGTAKAERAGDAALSKKGRALTRHIEKMSRRRAVPIIQEAALAGN